MAQFYLEALEDVPADLVDRALRHVRLNCTFMPKPAEFRAPIAAALQARIEARASALRDARIHRENRTEREPVTPAQRKRNLATLDEAVRILKDASKGVE